MNSDLTDEELIAAYRLNDSSSFGILFSRYRVMVYGVCLKYLKDREDAMDAVMQIFEKLQTQLKCQEIQTFKSWLYVTSRNHCLMHLRAGKGKIKVGIDTAFMESDLILHLEDEPDFNQNLAKLENCINELGSEQQLCIRQFYLAEKCYKEIVEISGFDLNKVKSYIQNGKRNLKICMERNG